MKYSVSAVACAMIIPLSAIRSLSAQTDNSSRVEQSTSATMLRVGRAIGAVKLDGASESVWSVADSISDFRQREPREGAPASERTVVKVLRDADALYILVRAYDRSTGEIRAG